MLLFSPRLYCSILEYVLGFNSLRLFCSSIAWFGFKSKVSNTAMWYVLVLLVSFVPVLA